jgi:hypothetical protein
MVVHTCIPSTQEAEKKDQEFEASLGYIERALNQKQQGLA